MLRLDPEHPEDSIVMVRPWLRDRKPDAPVGTPAPAGSSPDIAAQPEPDRPSPN